MKTNFFNGWLFLDKPVGLSSNKVLQTIRKLYGYPKGGFVGTLDPLASGFLPIAVGKATKAIKYLENCQKEYEFRVDWSKKTSTGDSEGRTIKKSDIFPLETKIRSSLKAIQDLKTQTPPNYSAIKVNGKRAYKLAREGIRFKIPERPIKIYDLTMINTNQSNLTDFYVRCSSGTYIRSLAESIADECNAICHVTKLRRTGFGKLDKKLISLDSLLSLMHIDNLINIVRPLGCVFEDNNRLELKYDDAKKLFKGIPINLHEKEIKNFFLDSSSKNRIIAKYKDDLFVVGILDKITLYPKTVIDLRN